MNILREIQEYFVQMTTCVTGMKIILLDPDTMGVLSMAFSQSEILQQEVYLFDLITSQNREQMLYLKAIVFIRPTKENINILCSELQNPKYFEYHIFFSNSLGPQYIEEIAQCDDYEVVREIQEYYADYYPITNEMFTLNIPSCVYPPKTEPKELLSRISDGLSSVLLSLHKKPIIRYENNSILCEKVAQEISRRIVQERNLYDFGKGRSGVPILLILDRKSDPVTPLLMEWTYQAMVHELIGIKNNRVIIDNCTTFDKQTIPEIVLSVSQDDFFAKNIYNNFGDVAEYTQKVVQELQTHTKANQNIQTLEGMKKFIQDYPEFQKQTGTVNKHIALMEELSQVVGERQLFDVSEFEQNIVCGNDHAQTIKVMNDILSNEKVESSDKLRLIALYSLRYEREASLYLPKFLQILNATTDFDSDDVLTMLKAMIKYSGRDARVGDLFYSKNWLAKAKRDFVKGFQGVSNVYTQHKPLLRQIIKDIIYSRLSDVDYPTMGVNVMERDRISDVIFFYVGGSTFEESLTVHEFNQLEDCPISFVIGGTTIHNSASFLSELRAYRDMYQNLAIH